MNVRNLLYGKNGRLRGIWRALMYLAIAMPLANLVAIILAAPLESAQVKMVDHPLLIGLIYGLAAIPAFMGAGSWVAARFEHLPPRTLGLSLEEPWLPRVLGGLLAGVLIIVLLLAVLHGAGMATITLKMPTTQDGAVIAFATICLLFASASAILLTQGYFFQTLLREHGLAVALCCSVVLYLVSPLLLNPEWWNYCQMIMRQPIWPLSMALNILTLCLLYLRSGSLWLPIGLNAGWNLGLALFSLNVGDPKPIFPSPFTATLHGHPLLIGGDTGPESGACVALLQALMFVVIIAAPRGLTLVSRWWEWRELQLSAVAPSAWDFSIGSRKYQWRFLIPEDSE